MSDLGKIIITKNKDCDDKAYIGLLKLEEKTKKERKEYIEKINKKNF